MFIRSRDGGAVGRGGWVDLTFFQKAIYNTDILDNTGAVDIFSADYGAIISSSPPAGLTRGRAARALPVAAFFLSASVAQPTVLFVRLQVRSGVLNFSAATALAWLAAEIRHKPAGGVAHG